MAASTVAEYLTALPADRRAAFSAVRKVINENLPDGYEEGMQFGMIVWHVPLSMYPEFRGKLVRLIENPVFLLVPSGLQELEQAERYVLRDDPHLARG